MPNAVATKLQDLQYAIMHGKISNLSESDKLLIFTNKPLVHWDKDNATTHNDKPK